jgi:hypothetical protein
MRILAAKPGEQHEEIHHTSMPDRDPMMPAHHSALPYWEREVNESLGDLAPLFLSSLLLLVQT